MVWLCSSCEGENSDEDYTCEHCGYVYYDPSFYQYEYNQEVVSKSQSKVVTKRYNIKVSRLIPYLDPLVSFVSINIIMKSFAMSILNLISLMKMGMGQKMILMAQMEKLVKNLTKFLKTG